MTGRVAWDTWREIADRVYVRRHQTLDVNAGLVLGAERCLVIDTLGSDREARELLDAVCEVTSLPFDVAVTHAHFDHCFGNATFASAQPGCRIWGHERCRAELATSGEQQRAASGAWLREGGEDELAAEVEKVALMPPDRTFEATAVIELGGREVALHHPGRGHTDHDVVLDVRGTGVTFVGDLVEQGAPPSFDDAYPLEWPDTVGALLPRLGAVVVPGHGDVVDPAFVAAQREDLAEVADLARSLPADLDDVALERAANRLAVGGPAGFVALRRARQQLKTGGPGGATGRGGGL